MNFLAFFYHCIKENDQQTHKKLFKYNKPDYVKRHSYPTRINVEKLFFNEKITIWEILPHAFSVNIWNTETAECHDESNV